MSIPRNVTIFLPICANYTDFRGTAPPKVWKGTILTKGKICATIGSVDESGASAKINDKGKNEASQKCEKMENNYYVIYDFMVERMKLKGADLLVYALIYSFTVRGGQCYGSMNYIAERVGASRTSVYRALKELVARNFIIKGNLDITDKITYVANLGSEFRSETGGVSECNRGSSKMTPNNKIINKEINNNTFIQGGVKTPSIYYGHKRLALITINQYQKLILALGYRQALPLLRQLEDRVIKSPGVSLDENYLSVICAAKSLGFVDERAEGILYN